MPAETVKSEQGVVLAAVLMVLAALSLMAVTGKGDAALQWLQVRNAREYAEAVQLAHTGIGMALAGDRFNIAATQTGRYCRIASRCVEWTIRHVETTPVPAGLDKRPEPRRALHFEVSAEGRAGTRARAPIVVGFVLITSGATDDPLPKAIEICAKEDSCPHDSAGPPIRRYWREEAS